MTKHRLLLGLAVVQALLVFVTWRRPDTEPPGAADLVPFDAEDIDSVEIADGDGAVVLERRDDAWVVASAGDYPVDPAEITDLLDDLGAISVGGDAIATNELSHAALDVADDGFGRRLTVRSGDDEIGVFVGRSDTGGLNVRDVGEAAVRAARGASLWDFAADSGSYVDRAFVELDEESLESILIENANGQLALSRSGDTWTPDVVPVGREVDEAAVGRLVRASTTVNLSEPVDEGAFPPTATVRVTWIEVGEDEEPEQGWFEIGAESDSFRYVRRHDSEHVVLASAASLRAILDASPMELSREPEPPES